MWLCSRVNTGHGLDWRELGRNIDSGLLAEWVAYRKLFPFGDDWEQAATIASVASVAGKFRKAIPIEKLIPSQKAAQQSFEQMFNTFSAMQAAIQ